MANKNLYQKIKNSIQLGYLSQQFSVKSVNSSLNNLLLKSPSFLSKHCVGNPGEYSEMFVRVRKGVYKLNPKFTCH